LGLAWLGLFPPGSCRSKAKKRFRGTSNKTGGYTPYFQPELNFSSLSLSSSFSSL
jgi:hypothetical protein